MWYNTQPTRERPDIPGYVCYAVSDDGIRWRKPELGLVEHAGSTANNIVLAHAKWTACVLHDPQDPAPERRYKMVYWGQSPGRAGGIYAAFSADGVAWRPHGSNPVLPGVWATGDTFSAMRPGLRAVLAVPQDAAGADPHRVADDLGRLRPLARQPPRAGTRRARPARHPVLRPLRVSSCRAVPWLPLDLPHRRADRRRAACLQPGRPALGAHRRPPAVPAPAAGEPEHGRGVRPPHDLSGLRAGRARRQAQDLLLRVRRAPQRVRSRPRRPHRLGPPAARRLLHAAGDRSAATEASRGRRGCPRRSAPSRSLRASRGRPRSSIRRRSPATARRCRVRS